MTVLYSLSVRNMPSLAVPSLKAYLIFLITSIRLIVDRREWSLDERLSEVEVMTVLLEDRRFFTHLGIDPKSILRATIGVLVGTGRGGASTIEMQLIRTVTERREKTFSRKFNEMVLALILGFHLGKGSILRTYMALAYYGTGLTGVTAATKRIYGKSPDQLSFEEASIIAAMLVYPRPSRQSKVWVQKIQRRARYGRLLYSRYKEGFQELRVSDY